MKLFEKIVKQVYRRPDNRGLSLVELICAVALFSIAVTAAGSVLVVSAQNYQRGVAEVELQQTAQLAVNQIEELIVDSTAAQTGDPNTLRIEKNGMLYEVYLDAGNRQLLYTEYLINPDSVVAATETQLLADNVDVFHVDMSNFAANGNVLLHVELSNATRSYAADFTITSRNGRNVAGSTAFGASISAVAELVLEPAESYTFPVTIVSNLMNSAINWTVTQNTDSNTRIEEAGTDASGNMQYTITVGIDEMADVVYFTAATQEMNGADPYSSQTVRVNVRRVKSMSIAAEKTSGSSSYAAGTVYKLTATPAGSNLEAMTGVPTDDATTAYVSPYSVRWEYRVTDFDGTTAPGNVTDYISYAENGLTTTITFNQNLNNYNLEVTAIANHPDGVNKTHIDYGDVSATWSLYMIIHSSDWARGGDSPMFIQNLDQSMLVTIDGKQYLKNFGEIHLTWFRTNLDGSWYEAYHQGNQGGWGESQDTNSGITIKFKEGDPSVLYGYMRYDNWNWAYSSPYYNGGLSKDFGVTKLMLQMDFAGLGNAMGVFNVEEVVFQYKNSMNAADEWSDLATGVHKIFVTPEDTTEYYAPYVKLSGGWSADNDNYVVYTRYVGVVEDNPGWFNDRRVDLTFITAEGAEHKSRPMLVNNMVDNGLTIELTTGAPGARKVTIKVTQAEKDAYCAEGLVVKEIFEYKPNLGYVYDENDPSTNGWYINPLWCPNDADSAMWDKVDGCDGILEFHFVQANVQVSNAVKPTVRYCPSPAELDGKNYYFINDNEYYRLYSDTHAEYHNDASGVTYDLYKDAYGVWKD